MINFKPLVLAFLLLILSSLPSFSEELIPTDSKNPIASIRPSASIDSSPLDDDISLTEFDFDRGIFKDEYNTADDNLIIAISANINSNLTKSTDLQSFEFNILKKVDVFWITLFAAQTFAYFEEITNNHETRNSSNLLAEEYHERYSYTEMTITSIGAGLAYRFKLFDNLLEFNNLFELINASISYSGLSDSARDQTYTGPGLKVDYLLHRRISTSYHYGLKFSYNLATVSRPPLDDEVVTNNRERSFTLSYATFGFEIAHYF
jgi:hypothetical protein